MTITYMKPLYIEQDEEVTSVIDRLRAQEQDSTVLVVPSGASLIQSAVNMRLLLREAEKNNKAIALVTADPYGHTLAEKVGIPVYSALDEVDGVEDVTGAATPYTSSAHDQIGTAAYYEDQERPYQPMETHVTGAVSAPGAQPINAMPAQNVNSSAYSGNGSSYSAPHVAVAPQQSIQQPVRMMDTVRPPQANGTQPSYGTPPTQVQRLNTAVQPRAAVQGMNASTRQSDYVVQQKNESPLDPHKEREVQAFFGSRDRDEESGASSSGEYGGTLQRAASSSLAPYAHVPGSVRASHRRGGRMIGVLGGIGVVLVAAVVAVIVFFPKVTVVLTPVTQDETIAMDIIGDVASRNVSIEQRTIGAVLLEETSEETITATPTGAARSATGAPETPKARGTITISNAFSSAPQPLVAKTRFETPEGYIFRLVSAVTVPGTTMKDGAVVAGTVEASVVADQPGSTYDIAATTFTIPGFKNGPKFEKIRATSAAAMTGGAANTDVQAVERVVTADDLAAATKSAEEKAIAAAKEKLRAKAIAQGRIVPDGALEASVNKTEASVQKDAVATTFTVKTIVTGRALAVADHDIEMIVHKELAHRADSKGLHMRDVAMQYSPAVPDFTKQSLIIKVQGTTQLVPVIDTEAVQRAIAGTKQADLDKTLATISGIAQAEFRYQSALILGRLPWYPGSITVEVRQ